MYAITATTSPHFITFVLVNLIYKQINLLSSTSFPPTIKANLIKCGNYKLFYFCEKQNSARILPRFLVADSKSEIRFKIRYAVTEICDAKKRPTTTRNKPDSASLWPLIKPASRCLQVKIS